MIGRTVFLFTQIIQESTFLTPPTAGWSGSGGFYATPASVDVSPDGSKYVTAIAYEFGFYDLDKHTKRADFAGPTTPVERARDISKPLFVC